MVFFWVFFLRYSYYTKKKILLKSQHINNILKKNNGVNLILDILIVVFIFHVPPVTKRNAQAVCWKNWREMANDYRVCLLFDSKKLILNRKFSKIRQPPILFCLVVVIKINVRLTQWLIGSIGIDCKCKFNMETISDNRSLW